MTKVPLLLDEAGEASIATAVMMSHHGFRRDVRRFGAALEALAGGGTGDVEALRDEWRSFRATLHGHHEAEDTAVFPHLAREHEALRRTLERLGEDHRRIDPLLGRGDGAFAGLPRTVATAAEIIAELGALLDPHLATEEAEVIPHLRAIKAFPPPASAEEAEMLTQGFAWACHGIAPEVLERVYTMLQPEVASRLPAARAAFEQRWRRVWGAGAEVTASFTPIPERTRREPVDSNDGVRGAKPMSEKKTKATNPSQKALEALTGRWEMAIRWSPKAHQLAGGPASVRGDARFEWIEDGHFLVQRQGGDDAPQARWLIGGDDTSGEYSALYSDARGISRVYDMTFADGVWRIWRKAFGFHQRFEGRLSADGRTIDGWWEKSPDGQSWERDFDLKYVKVD